VLVNDATILLRDIAGDAAQKAATKVNPSDEQLGQIDQAAEDNTWHEKPDFKQMKDDYQKKLPIGKKDAKDAAGEAAGDAAQTANPDGSRDPADAGALAAQEQQNAGTTTVDAKSGAKTGAQNFKNNLSSRFDDDQKEKMRAYRERTNNYFKNKMPQDRRDQIILRLKKMVVEIQSHQDCRSYRKLLTFLRLFDSYADPSRRPASN
jgi:hypothetical protein